MSDLLNNAVMELSKLPGIGKRTAMRLVLHLLRWEPSEVDQMSGALYQFRSEIRHCKLCNNLSDHEVCGICAAPNRDRKVVCVVEQVGDLLSIENTGQYHGLYHVLGGVISPMSGVAPSDLRIDKLLDVVRHNGVVEVIMALPTTVEGDTTQFYIARQLEGSGVRISVISRGIGFGDQLEYADAMTVGHALSNRQKL